MIYVEKIISDVTLLTLILPPTSTSDSSSIASSLSHPVTRGHPSCSSPEPSLSVASPVAAVVPSLALPKLTTTPTKVPSRPSKPSIAPSTSTSSASTSSATSRLVISTSSTSTPGLVATTSKAVPSVPGHTKRLLVQLLLRLPVVPDHLALAPLQSLTADVVEEALLLVIENFLIFSLRKFSLLPALDHVHLNLFPILFLGSLRRGNLSGVVVQLGLVELVNDALELLVGFLEVELLVKLQRLLLAWLRSARLESSPASTASDGSLGLQVTVRLGLSRALAVSKASPSSSHGATASSATVEADWLTWRGPGPSS